MAQSKYRWRRKNSSSCSLLQFFFHCDVPYVRRNNRKIARLQYETFYLSTSNRSFYEFVKYSVCLVLFLLLFSSGKAYADMQSPIETVKASNESILDLYRSSPETDAHVFQEIFSIMDKVTDYETMADSAMQNICPQKSEEHCKNIRQEFIESLKLAATTKLGRYRADRFEYIGEEFMAQQSLVKTVAYFKDESIQLNYILEQKDGNWRIVNYLVNDVDTIRNYQRQFKRIVAKETRSGLLRRLHNKNEQYRLERQKAEDQT